MDRTKHLDVKVIRRPAQRTKESPSLLSTQYSLPWKNTANGSACRDVQLDNASQQRSASPLSSPLHYHRQDMENEKLKVDNPKFQHRPSSLQCLFKCDLTEPHLNDATHFHRTPLTGRLTGLTSDVSGRPGQPTADISSQSAIQHAHCSPARHGPQRQVVSSAPEPSPYHPGRLIAYSAAASCLASHIPTYVS